MKILLISHIAESSGWGQASKDILLALDSVGVDVVSRHVKLGLPIPELPERVIELENKDSHGCDIVLQFVLPHLMEYHGGFKNIGLYCTETDSFPYSSWVGKLNQMDELWVPTKDMIRSAIDSEVMVDIKHVPYPCDVSKFEVPHQTLDIPPMAGDFVFYFIGDLTIRKNLPALIKAFHLEFHTSEPISLLLKTSKHGVSPEENTQKIAESCNQIKQGLKLYPKIEDYKSEIIISDRLSEEDLAKLHMSCDCFVLPSYGEAWCEPAIDALGYGNCIIANKAGGHTEFVNWENGYLCDYRPEPVFGMLDTFEDLFTGRECWSSIDINELRSQMRQAYDAGKDNPKREAARKTPYDFSYDKVGNMMKELLQN